ncbi:MULTISPECIES: radical SAM family heme chaperone HemW [Mesonia]|uniref:Oxygen-independent coproporphyrinogen-III oxidase-like protein YqeR n=1 Tax=Mesonia oceanica TaxID=2687242 RepID=A0AC61YD60_9FLAO|nr:MULTISPECIES: radical SAM family heme chaperone HemW [Mesonia]MAN26428.1 coproporphyrinogen III oxidase [Mesonia sp.]MAQ39568.1 coproporphyrinogen III oxidase [Mesonia sp.]MBJ99157.1 coproporphyrinogen III oxidase [Flavobacteriaceae bacterium]VVV02411.1 Oxygen-independent coproporphyrinogen-III oxidase-like protein YqeR [Mesonia oceanica]|tara:strand:- start:10294 stop:11418 length:1125 start_codon:yes stop_codon:yes gene_type:complete
MSGIYIHIPFCKQACHYCDFHFSTSLKKKGDLVEALLTELQLRKTENQGSVETIYFGGGTPSLLEAEEINQILTTVFENYPVCENPEITLEANPDDLNDEVLQRLANSNINRLSIGVQSFFEEDLQLMNRAHNAGEALKSIQLAKQYFDNISIDLIYGIPGMSNKRWQANLAEALALEVPHISSYALTVEPKTALKKMIETGKVQPVDEDKSKAHFEILLATLEEAGFINYEFSNFGKPGYFSQNNTAYWLGKPYLGIGPSAHSFDGEHRSWNVNNNTKYIKTIQQGIVPAEVEELSLADRYNEYVMTRLRTQFGVNLAEIEELFGKPLALYFEKESQVFFEKGLLKEENHKVLITKKGKFLSDGIAADLFYVD